MIRRPIQLPEASGLSALQLSGRSARPTATRYCRMKAATSPCPKTPRVVHRLDLRAHIPPAHMRDLVLPIDSFPRRGEHAAFKNHSVGPGNSSATSFSYWQSSLVVVLRETWPTPVCSIDRDNVPTPDRCPERSGHVHIVQLPLHPYRLPPVPADDLSGQLPGQPRPVQKPLQKTSCLRPLGPLRFRPGLHSRARPSHCCARISYSE